MANTTPPVAPVNPPLKQPSFAFPFRKKAQGATGSSADFTDEHEFYKILKDEPSGTYPVSAKGMWHGGIHVTEAGAGRSLDLKYGVRCLADGEVVAYRANRTYPVSELPAENGTAAISAPYSTGFALVRHSMEFPRGTTLTFYSLYMHLQDLADYESDTTLTRPAYWSKELKVTEFAQDPQHPGPNGQTAPTGQKGLRIRATKKNGTILGILPQGSQVTIGARDGNWGQIKDAHGATPYPPTVGGFVAPDVATNGWIFLGKESGGLVVEEIMPDSSLDQVVVLPEALKIKAGDLIGHLGRYDSLSQQSSNRMIHIEVFCDDSIKSFITQGQTWITSNGAHEQAWQQLGLPKDPTILRVDKNTTLYGLANQQGQDAKQTGVIQVASFAELARQPHNPSRETTAGADGQKLNWWHVGSADARGNGISGWVREQNFAGGRVTREFAQKWVDFQPLEDPHDLTHTMFAATQGYVDYSMGADVPDAGSFDRLSPLMQQIYQALSLTGDKSQAADRLCDAANHPWIALRMSRLIIRHESEWANPDKWKQLVAEIETQTGPQPQHEAEQQRIEKLVWWDDVKAGLNELPASNVFHIHPIGLVGNFLRRGFQFTLAIMQRMFPHANVSLLQEIIDELNLHIAVYKIDNSQRRCHFFGQILQEVGTGLALHSESLNYAASALTTGTFSYFTAHPQEAQLYGRTSAHPANQEAIANRVYAGSDLNAGPESGDGWRYRGRGMIQLTHRGGYKRFTKWHTDNAENWPQDASMDFELNPDAVGQIKYAVRSACYFWVANQLYTIADTGATSEVVDRITRKINPGLFSQPPNATKIESISGRRNHFRELNVWGGLQ